MPKTYHSELIETLRRTIRDLEYSENPESPDIQKLKRSILRSIADLELERDKRERKRKD